MVADGKGDRLKRHSTADKENALIVYPDHYPPENPSIWFRAISYFFIVVIVMPLIYVFMKLMNRTRVMGKENVTKLKPGWILASNHLTMIDDFLIDPIILYPACLRGYNYFPYHAPEETNYYKNRLMSWFMRQFKCIPLVRGKGIYQMGMDRLIESVINNGILHIYPEGTRSRTGKMGKFRPGIGRIICETKAPVVPVYYRGIEKILPIGKFFPRFGKDVILSIGKPIYFDADIGDEDPVVKWKSIAQELSVAIHKERVKAEEKWGLYL